MQGLVHVCAVPSVYSTLCLLTHLENVYTLVTTQIKYHIVGEDCSYVR